MRILIATPHRNLVGGVEKYLQSVIPALMRRGHSLALFHQYPFDQAKESIDAQVEHLPSWSPADLGNETAIRLVAEWQPDVVYSQGLDDSKLENALLTRQPTVLYAHTYHGTCISGRKCHSTPQIRPCGRRFGAQCLVLYYPRRCGGLHPGTMWKMYREQSECNAGFPRYQLILAASRHMCLEYEKHGAPRVWLLPLPMTSGIPETTAPLPRVPQGRILFVGRLVDVKGVCHLIRAIPEASRQLGHALTVTMAGDGSEHGKVRELAARLGVHIDFAGWLDAEQKLNLMRQADLLAVPSLWPEPFGLVGIEAGRLGVPAAGFAVGGIPDWLIAGETGELAPGDPPTPQGLAAAIARALADPDHYNQLRHGAWLKSNQFTLERHLDQLESILGVRQPAEVQVFGPSVQIS
jgi:glycosyltransferase involved in cell wall biosynthesis